jgi:hypothetical protein
MTFYRSPAPGDDALPRKAKPFGENIGAARQRAPQVRPLRQIEGRGYTLLRPLGSCLWRRKTLESLQK